MTLLSLCGGVGIPGFSSSSQVLATAAVISTLLAMVDMQDSQAKVYSWLKRLFQFPNSVSHKPVASLMLSTLLSPHPAYPRSEKCSRIYRIFLLLPG